MLTRPTRPLAARLALTLAALSTPLAAVTWNAFDQLLDTAGSTFSWAGESLAAGDFDGDGIDDLAIGTPYFDEVGRVTVRLGSASGLGAPATLVGSRHLAEFGASLAAGDFDGDDDDELAVGAPRANVGESDRAGIVEIWSLDGGNWSLLTTLAQTGDDLVAEPFDHFGRALAAGDFDGDGSDDLAVGVPLEDLEATGDADAGAVLVYSGYPAFGLVASDPLVLHEDVPGLDGVAEIDDQLGSVLTFGDFDGDGRDDLAIGVPRENLSTISNVGAVYIVPGSSDGLHPEASLLLDESDFGGTRDADDEFGAALAAGNLLFEFPARDELVIGIEGQAVQGESRAGAIALYRQSPALAGIRTQLHLGALPEEFDRFGSALAAGDFDGSGSDDLAIGSSGEDADEIGQGGMIQVALSVGGTLDFENAIQLRPNDAWQIDVQTEGAVIGLHLAAGDFRGTGDADLACGIPTLNNEEGGVLVLYSALFADDFETGDIGEWVP